MKMIPILVMAILIFPLLLFPQDDQIKISKILQNTDLSVQWFLNYGYDATKKIGSFTLKRGYFTIKTKVSDVFSVRYTQDITLDKEGEDAGNVEMRLKYMYLKMSMDQFEFLPISYFEFGMVHRPWLDFEEHINIYRAQGTMFVERVHLINSADFGITYTGLIGERIDEKYQKEVNNNYPGKYGSFSVGVYNGGGYHAFEANNNKTLEGRLTLRPLSSFMPGLQLSYNFVYGKANIDSISADFQINQFFVSSESKYHVATLQYYTGKGDQGGILVGQDGKSFNNDGYSAFGEFKIPETNFALFGRYDKFSSDQDTMVKETRTIGGIAYKFLKNEVFVDLDQHHANSKTTNIYELALEIHF
jgi:hypothetical protein